MNEADSLRALRDRIDALDRQIQTLISERARCAQQVGAIKQAAGATGNFYRPEREAQVLRRVLETNPGPLSNEEMARLFREVEAGSADYGVVPVENSTEGVVNHTLDMFLQSPLRICGEVQIRINHHLITRAAELTAIRRIYSHRQSLAQCREWLDANLPRVEQIEVSSNGEAALRVRDEADAAAIAGQCAADIYQLPTLVRNIEDEPNNTTRFLIIGTQPIAPSGDDKTALLVASLNRPGALFNLLEPLARNKVSMNRIESRPSRRGMWDYVFFIDLDGHAQDEPVASTLTELREQASLFRVLGSYPKGVL